MSSSSVGTTRSATRLDWVEMRPSPAALASGSIFAPSQASLSAMRARIGADRLNPLRPFAADVPGALEVTV